MKKKRPFSGRFFSSTKPAGRELIFEISAN